MGRSSFLSNALPDKGAVDEVMEQLERADVEGAVD